jgi:hypothetical protein
MKRDDLPRQAQDKRKRRKLKNAFKPTQANSSQLKPTQASTSISLMNNQE